MNGQTVPHDIYVHIAGIDIVRVDADDFYVLEDNARTPSGVSYMLENREMMMRLFPELFVAPPRRAGRELSRRTAGDAALGRAASAAARSDRRAADAGRLQLGLLRALVPRRQARRRAGRRPRPLREGRRRLHAHDRRGRKRVDVIYRRIDDDFLDPLAFRPDSALGVPGLMAAYQAGNVTLANAVGTGVADDKAVYSYMPEIVRFYLGEEPILKNVPTWRCREPEHLAYVLDHLDGAGGEGSPRLRRLRHAGRPARRQGDDRRRSAPSSKPRRRTSSPSRRSRSRPARPSSTRASRRATSTCGPSC